MPTLALDPAIDTTVPGHTRRRIWLAPAIQSHSLVVLTLTKISLAPAAVKVNAQLAQRIQNGADVEGTLGELVTTIDISTIQRVKFDLVTNSLTIEYHVHSGKGSHGGVNGPTCRAMLTFKGHDAADEVYTKLWRRLGDRFELKPIRRDTWDLARFPVAVMAGILVLTTVFGILGNAAADSSQSTSFWRHFATYDWRLVCGFGGASLAILQMWLYRRLTQPPKELELGLRYPDA
jgi:hypothetical protein